MRPAAIRVQISLRIIAPTRLVIRARRLSSRGRRGEIRHETTTAKIRTIRSGRRSRRRCLISSPVEQILTRLARRTIRRVTLLGLRAQLMAKARLLAQTKPARMRRRQIAARRRQRAVRGARLNRRVGVVLAGQLRRHHIPE